LDNQFLAILFLGTLYTDDVRFTMLHCDTVDLATKENEMRILGECIPRCVVYKQT